MIPAYHYWILWHSLCTQYLGPSIEFCVCCCNPWLWWFRLRSRSLRIAAPPAPVPVAAQHLAAVLDDWRNSTRSMGTKGPKGSPIFACWNMRAPDFELRECPSHLFLLSLCYHLKHSVCTQTLPHSHPFTIFCVSISNTHHIWAVYIISHKCWIRAQKSTHLL